MLWLIYAGIIITNLTNNTLPWNTSNINGNFTSIPNLILQNSPWFFPFITMVLLLATDYLMSIKAGTSIKMTTLGVTIAYTILGYAEVVGGISGAQYFYIFEFIMLMTFISLLLFKKEYG